MLCWARRLLQVVPTTRICALCKTQVAQLLGKRKGRNILASAFGRCSGLPPHTGRMLMARASTRMAITSDRVDWTIMVSLAHRLTGKVSVGLNAVALV